MSIDDATFVEVKHKIDSAMYCIMIPSIECVLDHGAFITAHGKAYVSVRTASIDGYMDEELDEVTNNAYIDVLGD